MDDVLERLREAGYKVYDRIVGEGKQERNLSIVSGGFDELDTRDFIEAIYDTEVGYLITSGGTAFVIATFKEN
jgi:hypothetical protein